MYTLRPRYPAGRIPKPEKWPDTEFDQILVFKVPIPTLVYGQIRYPAKLGIWPYLGRIPKPSYIAGYKNQYIWPDTRV